MMYAIVKTGGKQYRVEQGQTLLVERLPEDEGTTVGLEPLLYRDSEAVFAADALAKVSVRARIVGHERGEKLRVFKFKPKRGYRRRTGHRQELTRIEVTEIKLAAGAAGGRRAGAKPAQEDAAGPARAKAPTASGGAATRPAAARSGAAKAGAAKRAPAKPPAKPAPKEEDDGS